ncbi:MAG: DegV family protein [Anaerolineae bacterium]|jgi:DegV family protein with EDD domain
MTSKVEEVAIVTDSTCDIPPELLEQYGITVVPLYLMWGDEELVDGVDIDNATFYARLPNDPNHPSTSQPTPADFTRVLKSLQARDVVIITLTKELSGTYASACQAEKQAGQRCHVVDSRSLSMGLGWQVLAAARAREEGADAEGMIAAAARVRERSQLLLTVDTLEYLHRGGRIGTAAKFLGSAVQLKPLLEVNHTTGTLEPVGRVRTRKRAVSRLLEDIFSRVDPDKPMRVTIIHGAAAEEAEGLLQQVKKLYEPLEVIVTAITPVLGVHGGPGVLGIGVYNE